MILLVLCLLWGAAAAGLAWHVAVIGREITYVTLADGRRQERRLPLAIRLLLPLTPNLTPFFRRSAFTTMREAVARRIVAAGFEGLLTDVEILALRALAPLTFGLLWIVLVKVLVAASPFAFIRNMEFALCLLGIFWCYLYPAVWLKGALNARHRSIRRSLPFVLDLLTLSVEAGMDFMTALQRNVERGVLDPLGEELLRVIREIQLGKTRREALRDMSARVDLPDLRSVINAMVQADELGVSIGSILRIQADQIRQRRFERAETLANQAPVKMLGPLIFFIFPAVIIILLGPILARMAEHGF